MKLITRHADTEDAAAIGVLMDAAFDARYGEAWSTAQVVAALAISDTWGELALANERPVGFSLTRRVGEEAELLLIAVSPEWRHHGIARQLLARAAESAAAKGAAVLFLEVRETNIAALHLYEDAGFAVVGRRKNYYSGPGDERFDAITMRRDLRISNIG